MKKLQYILLAIVGLSISACTDGFDEINENPNEPTSVPNEYLLTSAQKSFMDNTLDEWWAGRRGNQLAQYWASNQYSAESRYQLRTGITNTYWSNFYSGTATSSTAGGGIANLDQIILNNEEVPAPNSQNQIAVAKTLKVWIYQMITDSWGAAPMTEAVKLDAIPSPKYDSQEAIYTQMLALINEAVNAIDESQAGPNGDAIYGGDMGKWKKFANSLKLRVAMRMADRKSEVASAAVSEAVASGVFSSNDDDALFVYFSGAPNNHPMNEAFKTRTDFAASNVMVDMLLELNDPRVQYFYSPTANSGEYVGEEYGLSEANAAITPDADVSQLSPLVTSATLPGVYMDNAQVQFLLAEAVERGYISGNAKDYYNAGIRSSMLYWSGGALSESEIDAYIAQSSVDYDVQTGDDTWKNVIGAQKWIALFNQGIEGWAEYRRLDFGILQLPADGTLEGNGIPTRMKYPLNEYSRNKGNLSEAVSNQGEDSQDTKLWWDVN